MQTKQKLEKEIQEVKKEMEKPKRWRAEIGGKYWFIDEAGNVDFNMEENDEIDNYRFKHLNYFETREEAEQYKEYLKAIDKMRECAEYFKPNFNIYDKIFYINYNREDKNFESRNNYEASLTKIYFDTEKKAQYFIDDHKKELEIIRNYESV